MSRTDALAAAAGRRESAMFALLADLVNIQSGSRHKAGVDRVGARIRRHLEDLPVRVATVPQADRGDHLVVRTAAATEGARHVLMVGHMDTVFPEDSDFTDYWEDGSRCGGPGIIDMKGGLVAGIFALELLNDAGLLAPIPVTFIFNSDEEVGSHSSRPLIREAAARSRFAFVMECGGMADSVVTSRKGNRSFRLTYTGRAGHAAAAGADKASAVLALARHTIALEALNDPDAGISVNVGKITGGIGPNTVAERAEARVDLRFTFPEDEARVVAAIDAIAARTAVPGVACRLETVSRRPPMPPTDANRRLFDTLAGAADQLGTPVTEEFRFGVSDANIIADEGTPVLDGLGPLGEHDHSDREYMVKDSLLRRTLLLAHAIAVCWDRFDS